MRILHRLPYFEKPTIVQVRGEGVSVAAYQIIVQVSIHVAGLVEWDRRTRFPAILDTGNNFNFTIHQSQLIRWAGIRPELLRFLGTIRKSGEHFPRHAASLWLHPNVPGSLKVPEDREPFHLTLNKGIAVYPDGQGPAPNLPLIGLRALSDNNLDLAVVGRHREVSLHTKSWLSTVLRALGLPPY